MLNILLIFIILVVIVLLTLVVIHFTSNKKSESPDTTSITTPTIIDISNSLYEQYLIEYASKKSKSKFKFIDGSVTSLLNDLWQKLLVILPSELRNNINCIPNKKQKL